MHFQTSTGQKYLLTMPTVQSPSVSHSPISKNNFLLPFEIGKKKGSIKHNAGKRTSATRRNKQLNWLYQQLTFF